MLNPYGVLKIFGTLIYRYLTPTGFVITSNHVFLFKTFLFLTCLPAGRFFISYFLS